MATLSDYLNAAVLNFLCLQTLKGLLWSASADCSYLTYSIRAGSPHGQDSWAQALSK